MFFLPLELNAEMRKPHYMKLRIHQKKPDFIFQRLVDTMLTLLCRSDRFSFASVVEKILDQLLLLRKTEGMLKTFYHVRGFKGKRGWEC